MKGKFDHGVSASPRGIWSHLPLTERSLEIVGMKMVFRENVENFEVVIEIFIMMNMMVIIEKMET